MEKLTVTQYFGTQEAVAKALGINQASIAKWKEVPRLRQLQLESLTGGALKADTGILPRRTRKVSPKSLENKVFVSTVEAA